jgi:hypothetical protein
MNQQQGGVLSNILGQGGLNLGNLVQLPEVTLTTDKKTDNVLLGTAAIIAIGLIAAAVIMKKK